MCESVDTGFGDQIDTKPVDGKEKKYPKKKRPNFTEIKESLKAHEDLKEELEDEE